MSVNDSPIHSVVHTEGPGLLTFDFFFLSHSIPDILVNPE
jgi:hypothetical protein